MGAEGGRPTQLAARSNLNVVTNHHPSDPLTQADEFKHVIDFVAREALAYLEELDTRLVRQPGANEAVERFVAPLPEEGDGAVQTLETLLTNGLDGTVTSAGPRFFHWVIGGSTPASLGADWITSVLDQNNGGWDATPLATKLEMVSIDWLKDLFELPQDWTGVLTTGATMANFTSLAAARQWWSEQHGIDIADQGFHGLPAPQVMSSGWIHSSARKALGMLGLGRSAVRVFGEDAIGTLDLAAMEAALADLKGAPSIIVGNAGEVNAGHFEPIDQLADLADRYNAWLHVDGAFGLFARISPDHAHLAAGIERADSVIADGHKWLNVPYDNGFAFVRDGSWLPKAFSAEADYLPDLNDDRPSYIYLGPEMSRRARSFTVWATLRAYGRAGYRSMVERNLRLAQHLAGLVDADPHFERLADVPLNIVCFRYRPDGVTEEEADRLNQQLGEAILADGRVYAGTTVWDGKVALRPAIVNWRTTERDVDLLMAVVKELAARL